MSTNTGDEKPDPGKARAELERVRKQRPRVDRLVAALLSEKRQNNFAANMFDLDPRRKRT